MSNVIEFKFERIQHIGYENLRLHYEKIFDIYVREVLNMENDFELKIENLNRTALNGNYNWVDGPTDNILSIIAPYTYNTHITYSSKAKRLQLFSFYIYGQNNCCGALTVSKTSVHRPDMKIGQILQHFKEDYALIGNISLLTCTDVYSKYYNYTTDEELNKLQPHLPNTKVLLNTGWKVNKLFYNRNSKNVVALYTKEVKPLTENKTITMKIREENTLVKIENVSIGADPELFLRSKDSGEFVASYSIITGDKNNPTVISERGHNIQCDNVMVEYGIPPSKNVGEFLEHNMFVQSYLQTKHADPNNLELVIFPFAEFTSNELKDDRAQHFGCDPDYNVWKDGQPNEVGRAGATGRCAGGHIHVGYDNHNRVTSNYIVKALDLFLSVPLVLMEPDNRRKEMYGKAGSFRPQPWGVEYRSTSNYIFSSPELMKWAFNQTMKAIEFVNNVDKRNLLDNKSGFIIEAINDKSKSSAEHLIEYFKLNVLEAVKTN